MSRAVDALSGISVQDIGSLVNANQNQAVSRGPLLRQGQWFRRTPVEQANDEDKQILREGLKVSTIINTHTNNFSRPGCYDQSTNAYARGLERCTVENVLDLIWCHLRLRGTAYVEDLLGQLSLW